MKKIGQIVFGQLVPWIIAAAVLVMLVILYIKSNDKGTSIVEFLKNMWRFGR